MSASKTYATNRELGLNSNGVRVPFQHRGAIPPMAEGSDSYLPQLLTGEWLETDDKLVAAVARELSSAKFQRELNRATWLNVRIGRGEGATPIKTINSVCRALGIVVESRQTKAGGRKRSQYRYLIPVRGGTT